MRRLLALTLSTVCVACVDLTLPPPPAPPGPGSLQATLVYAVPGSAEKLPAANARVRLLSSALETTTNADGYFRLEGIAVDTGAVLIEHDVDGDGKAERSRRLDLADVKGGFGKQVSLGTVVLGRNASVTGLARGEDRADQPSGHAATSVFVPEGPFATQTADDGSYLLPDMPEGDLTVAFFRAGYEPQVINLRLRPGERTNAEAVRLTPKGTADLPGQLAGLVQTSAATALAGATVSTDGVMPVQTTSGGDGRFTVAVPTGVYRVAFTAPGHRDVIVPNVLVASGTATSLTVSMLEGMSGAGGGSGTTGGGSGATGGGGGSTTTGGGSGTTGGGSGNLPIARIGPLPTHFEVGPNAPMEVTISGALSSGQQPLRYRWRQVSPRDGGVDVEGAVQANGTDGAGAFTVVTPHHTLRQQVQLELVVTDALGQQSAPTLETLTFANPPEVEANGLPQTVRSGTSFVVEGDLSDGNEPPLIITSWSWSVAEGTATLAPTPDGRFVTVTTPAVTAPTTLRLRLRTENAYGLFAEQDLYPIVVLPPGGDGGATWTLSASVTVDGYTATSLASGGLQSVTLEATTNLPTDGGVSFSWTPTSAPSGPPWTLSGANTARASFITPELVGQPQVVLFTVTASAPGETPPTQTAQVSLIIEDRKPPQVVGDTLVNGVTGSMLGFSVFFDEPLMFDDDSGFIEVTNSFGGVATGRVVGNRVDVVPTALWTPQEAHAVRVVGVTDASPRRNVYNQQGDVYATFISTLNVSQAFVSTESSVVSPWPALMTATDGGQTTHVQLAARRGATSEAAWFLEPQPAFSFGCPPTPVTQPCPLGTQDAGVITLSPDAGTGLRRTHQLGQRLVAMLEARGLGAPETVVAQSSGGRAEIVTFPASGPVGPLGSDGTTLLSTGALSDGGLAFSSLNAATLQWTAQDIDTTVTWPTNAPLAVSGTAQRRMVAGVHDLNRPAVVNDGIPSWATYDLSGNVFGATSLPHLGVARGVNGPDSAVAYLLTLQDVVVSGLPQQRLQTLYISFGAPPLLERSSDFFDVWVTSFDFAYRQPMGAVAYVVAGQLRVALQFDNAFQAPTAALPGAHPDGVMNVNPACEAANPSIAFVEDFLYLAWQERCAGQDWKVAMRALR